MEKDQEFDFESFKQEAIRGMYAGKPLNGEKGIFAPLLKHFLESALAGELEAHLQEEKAAGLTNRKNGKTSKKVKSLSGEFELETTRDRSGSFDPIVKVREGSSVVTRAVYNILGVSLSGTKDLIGMYLSESEGAKFWLSVLTDLKSRGVEDMLIVCIDGLKGFPEAIAAIFPQTEIQTCVVHQIRSSLRYIAEKDKKAFIADLKPVYQAFNQEEGYENLLKLDEKWGKKYPVPLQGWYNNWEHLSTFFKYDAAIRKVIYSTNIVEGFHRQVRKVTKTKGAFTSDNALLKLIYLVVQKVSEKWTMPLHNWRLTLSQLYIRFEERLTVYLKNG
ncbi:IS256 family transposase [Adhaeribacter arboris]|uniref:Mutator family transposase n=1 Tax=Adhaeribacter arboris TaxID=2072846 RepID=A0A2T2YKE0_9BACT|nr:IS256 family transposase [Adhaeribacter arboris]PSR55935.1 IS256 family transposase [Adhaeribacter arboris]